MTAMTGMIDMTAGTVEIEVIAASGETGAADHEAPAVAADVGGVSPT
jgi:hypothetical protein